MARRPAVTRKQIVEALVSLGAELGRSPTNIEFQARSSITWRQLKRHFKSWKELLAAAGLPANTTNSIPSSELLDDWGHVARKLGHCPHRKEYHADGKYASNTFIRRFKSWSGVGRAFYTRSAEDPMWQDVVKSIRDREACRLGPWLISPRVEQGKTPLAASEAASSSRSLVSCNLTYGDPIDFDCLRNAPVNETGVVFLFGCLARKLGYIVEAIQINFPDCEAKRKDPDGKLRRVRIEFEYESRNFELHKHDVNGCDIIVCWRHNWEECPLQVIDLSVELQKLKQAA